MKKLNLLLTIGIVLLVYTSGLAQIIDPNKKIENEGENRANNNIDKGIDKGFDKLEDGIGNLFKKKKKDKPDKDKQDKDKQDKETVSDDQDSESNSNDTDIIEETSPILNWSKYDFVPGDKVIFEDNLAGEENGEFPSRWDLKQGNVEIAEFGGENVIMFRDGRPSIVPYFKDASKDYLPDVFTIEFDLYCGQDNFQVFLFDRKNQKTNSPTGYTDFRINYYQMQFGRSTSRYPDGKNLAKRRWMHVAVAYTNGKLKGYMDETRLINIPRLDFEPKGLSLHIYSARDNNLYYVKNIRIAEGGVKYYDRILQDGKIIATGIRFDVGKATLKQESMGIINKIVKMMQDHPDLKFSIEGHTDSDGNDANNLKLSEERAKTVMDIMVKSGIAADRLNTKGFGESVPINTNNTPEGKANNRRVEFIKI
ncbi:MAG: OmpA family protein [Bacteroidales bacterium]|nr:OmpA family protein [Bacteroidales bacterium]